MSHTPTPFKRGGLFDPDSPDPRCWIWGPTAPGDASGEVICKWVKPDNADFILLACNAHDDLLATLEDAMLVWGLSGEEVWGDDDDAPVYDAWPEFTVGHAKRLFAAIEKAGGKC